MNKTGRVIVTATATIIAAVIGAYAGKSHEQNTIGDQIAEVIGNNVNIVGDSNVVTINDPISLANEYLDLKEKYDSLQEANGYLVSENKSYSDKLDSANQTITELAFDTEQEINDLKAQIDGAPVIVYKDLSLCVDTMDIPINSINSEVTIDGKEYFSRDIVESLVPESKSVTIKEGTIFVGNVIKDKTSLYDIRTMDKAWMDMIDSITDSYGNNYSHVLLCNSGSTIYGGYPKFIIYETNREYSFLRITLAIRDNAELNASAILTIKADDQVVFTSNTLTKKMEPLSIIDIPINRCGLLTIEYNATSSNFDCIISDAVLYN